MEMEEPEVVVVEEYFVEEDKAIETEEKEVDFVAQPSSCRSQLFVTLSQLEKIKTILKTEKESIKMIKEEGIDFFKLFGSYEKVGDKEMYKFRIH